MTRFVLSTSVVLAAVLTVQIQAQESPLAQVPANAAVVIHVKGVEHAKNRLAVLLKNAVPDFGPVIVAQAEALLQSAGRSFKGLSPEGPVFVVLPDFPEDLQSRPKLAIVARVTDYATFRDGLLKDDERKTIKKDAAGVEEVKLESEDSAFFINRKEYAVFALDKAYAETFAKKQPGLDTKLGKEAAERLLKPDISAYVDLVAVNKTYGENIKNAVGMIGQLIESGAAPGVDKNQLATGKKMLDGLVQLLADSRWLVASLNFEPEGLALRAEVQVAGDSGTNGFLKSMKPVSLEEVATLPAGQLGYAAMRLDGGMFKAFGAMMQGLATEADTDESKAARELVEKLGEARPQLQLSAMNLRNDNLQITHLADAAKATGLYLKLFKSLKEGSNFSNMALKKAELKENAEAHRGYKFHHVELVWDLEKAMAGVPGGEQFAEAMKKVMGEGARIWFGTDGKTFVQITAADWNAARANLDRLLDKNALLGQERAYQTARKQLPAQATMIGLVNVPKMAHAMAEYMHTMFKSLGLGALGDPPAAVKADPVYIGGAVTLQPELMSLDVWLPATAVKEFRRVFEPMIRAIMQLGS